VLRFDNVAEKGDSFLADEAGTPNADPLPESNRVLMLLKLLLIKDM